MVLKAKNKFLRFLPVYIMALPGILYLIINNYLPMFGIIIAFKDYNVQKGILGSDWAGLKNFEYLLKHKMLGLLQEILFYIMLSL